MSSELVISNISDLMTQDLSSLVRGILIASARGIKVYMTKDVYKALSDTLNELGITAREVNEEIKEQNYILIKDAGGIKIKIEIYENGKIVNSVTTTSQKLEKALREYLAISKGASSKGDQPQLYELILPEDLSKGLKIIGEDDKDEGES